MGTVECAARRASPAGELVAAGPEVRAVPAAALVGALAAEAVPAVPAAALDGAFAAEAVPAALVGGFVAGGAPAALVSVFTAAVPALLVDAFAAAVPRAAVAGGTSVEDEPPITAASDGGLLPATTAALDGGLLLAATAALDDAAAVRVSGVALPAPRGAADSSIVRPLKVDASEVLLGDGEADPLDSSLAPEPAAASSGLAAEAVIFRCAPDFVGLGESRPATACVFSPRSISVLKNCRRG